MAVAKIHCNCSRRQPWSQPRRTQEAVMPGP
jgi:hypothetical protein